MRNSQNEETKKENVIEEQKKESIDDNNNNINNENINNSERSRLKIANKNTKQIEREGTDINLLPDGYYINKKIKKEEPIEEKDKDSNKKEEQIEIKVEEQIEIKEDQNQKQSEVSDYSNLPKIKNGKIYTKAEMFVMDVKEAEDTCDKCPLRCLVFIPIYIGYCFLSIFDFLTYLIVPLGYCLFYTIVFICIYCIHIVSKEQVEEEIGFSGAFTSENEIKLHLTDQGGITHLNEILCFSYMSACVKRYFCFIFVIINHIIVPILQAWKKSRDCFIPSRIEQEYDARMEKIEEAKKYRNFDQVEAKIEISDY